MLALQPTDHWWWLVRVPGLIGLLLSGMALLLPPAPDGTPWHRLLGSFAIVAVSPHVLSVAAFEPSFWRWLTCSVPVEILCGLVARWRSLRRWPSGGGSLRSGLGKRPDSSFTVSPAFTVVAASAMSRPSPAPALSSQLARSRACCCSWPRSWRRNGASSFSLFSGDPRRPDRGPGRRGHSHRPGSSPALVARRSRPFPA